MEKEEIKELKDGDSNILHEGDRVYTYDHDLNGRIVRYYGTLVKNDYPDVLDWAVEYDDGICCAVLDFKQIYKA